MPGFPPSDHARVANATRWYEQHANDLPAPQPDRPPPRGLVRVMLTGDFYWVNPGLPLPVAGDFPFDSRLVRAVITEPLSADRSRFDYFVRCVAINATEESRTWQLRLIDENGNSHLTAPIAEHATSSTVRDTINATGCPPCEVTGYPDKVLEGSEPAILPKRFWHLHWPVNGWLVTTTRETSPDVFEYETGVDEVPIALIPTAWRPTGIAERVFLPYSRPLAAPTPGAFALCQPLPGRGLAIVDLECVNYVDV